MESLKAVNPTVSGNFKSGEKMNKQMIDNAMKDIAAEAKNIYGEKLKEVILFGSCARGDFEDDSDVDVMILLDVPRSEVEEADHKMDPVISRLDKKYEYELLFSPIVQSYSEFNYWIEALPFYQNVRKEGIRYA